MIQFERYRTYAELYSNLLALTATVCRYEKNAAAFTDVGALGNFVENHDQTRWLLTNPDHRSYQNGLAAAFFLPGVPIAYYGTEQGMAGGQSDNDKRQALWRHGGYNTTSRLYQWTKDMVSARKRMLRNSSVATIDVVHNFHSEDKFLSFERNGAVVIIAATIDPKTKQPLEGQTVVTVPTEFAANIELCDALMPTKRQYIQPDLIDSVPTKISATQSQCSTTLAQLCGFAKHRAKLSVVSVPVSMSSFCDSQTALSKMWNPFVTQQGPTQSQHRPSGV